MKVVNLQKMFLWSCQEVNRCGELTEAAKSQFSQFHTMGPVHDQIQVGSDLDTAGPLVEYPSRTCIKTYILRNYSDRPAGTVELQITTF